MTTDAKTPTLLIKSDNPSLLSGRFELNGHPIKADKITLEMDANDGARLTLDVAAYDGLDLVLPATAAVTLWLSEPGTLEVNGSERGIAEPIEVTPGEVSRRWTFRRQESTSRGPRARRRPRFAARPERVPRPGRRSAAGRGDMVGDGEGTRRCRASGDPRRGWLDMDDFRFVCRVHAGAAIFGIDASRWSRRIVLNYPRRFPPLKGASSKPFWSRVHKPGACAHGPQTWPRWSFAVLKIVRARFAEDSPSIGWNVWLYTRWLTLSPSITWDRRRHWFEDEVA